MSECRAELVDGTWDTSLCGCEDCVDVDRDAIEHQYEAGAISLGEALAAHERLDLGGAL